MKEREGKEGVTSSGLALFNGSVNDNTEAIGLRGGCELTHHHNVCVSRR